MACDFQSLYYGEDGYVVRCKQCGHYQVAFVSTMLTLSEADFYVFCKQVNYKAAQSYSNVNHDSKIIMIATPSQDVHLILTPSELSRLQKTLEAADNEIKAQELLCLFKEG
ncbi:DUF6686 family protein [Niabella ginsengisoli]|uniref:Uncharacterized protein n=1 Tax=Niabella ginsengisoli TaxID=522298 RepID=A0ABS9SQ77_9BACT|nr:DUF6686 family protein [Niabella ginsengisoli]MCH5600525.1 hypothetical protein [Niabella ginsengisoli]